MKTIELRIDGMTCEHCARRVATALEGVAGTEDARVTHAEGSGSVRVADDVDAEALVRAVEDAGYGAEAVSGEAGAAGKVEARPGDPDPPTEGGADADLLVIGTGSAGMAAAIRGAELGRRVLIVEGGMLGGTCVNVGCIPSKNLIAAAEHLHRARRGFPGIEPCEPSVDWREVVESKRELVGDLRRVKYRDVLDAYPEIRLVEGRARLLGGSRVDVDGTTLRAHRIVVATGTSPWMPPIPGLDEVEALDSATAMELDAVPGSLVVLGGGPVGLELAQTFARFGSRVTVLELASRLLPLEDASAARTLRDALEAEGLEIHTGARTTRVERDGEEVVVHAEVDEGGRPGEVAGEGEPSGAGPGAREAPVVDGGGSSAGARSRTLTFRAHRILVATGERPNTDGLGLEEAGVETDERSFIGVDAGMRTSEPSIFAAGDVAGLPGFVYVAAAAGRVAAENALDPAAGRELDLSAVPRVVFTSPQVAGVGLGEEEARARGFRVETGTLELAHLPRAAVEHQEAGWIRVVSDGGSGRVLGLQAVAPGAAELLSTATLVVRKGLTVDDLVETLHPYLTWVEGLKLAAQTVEGDVTKLSCCA